MTTREELLANRGLAPCARPECRKPVGRYAPYCSLYCSAVMKDPDFNRAHKAIERGRVALSYTDNAEAVVESVFDVSEAILAILAGIKNRQGP